MPLTDYTTYLEVRAALGTNVDEIDDTTLALPMYELGLVADLEDIKSALVADYVIAKAVAQPRPANTQAFVDAVQLFSPYAVAGLLASSLPLFSPKQVGEGKAGFSRYADSPYKTSIDNAKKLFDRYRTRLSEKYATYKATTETTVFRPFFATVTPSVDPVVG